MYMLKNQQNKSKIKNLSPNLEASNNNHFILSFVGQESGQFCSMWLHLGLPGGTELVTELVWRVQDGFTHIPDVWDSWLDGLLWATLPLKVMSGTLHAVSLGEWTSDVATEKPPREQGESSVLLKARVRTTISSQHLSWPYFFWSEVVRRQLGFKWKGNRSQPHNGGSVKNVQPCFNHLSSLCQQKIYGHLNISDMLHSSNFELLSEILSGLPS